VHQLTCISISNLRAVSSSAADSPTDPSRTPDDTAVEGRLASRAAPSAKLASSNLALNTVPW
jgi:hypothetical protein